MLVKCLTALNKIEMDILDFTSSINNGKLTHLFTVSECVYESFKTCSGDMNPLHTNESFAQNKGFKSKVMYGNILNAFLSYFVGECLPTKEVIIHSQDIAYKNPVYLNDELRFESEIDSVHESVNVITFKFKFINKYNKLVAKGQLQIGLL